MTETFRNRIVKTVQMRIGDIEPHPFNPRTHPQEQMDPLRGHLTETGKTRVPTAYYSERNGGKLTFTDGHGRQAINPDEVWTIAITDLTDAEADLDLAVGDPLSALAGTDAAKLDDLLRDVSTGDAALQAMLGELAEAAGIGAGVEPGQGGDEFDTTPDDDPTRAQPGDLWIIGGVHRLLVGDCTDAANVARLMGGERAAMMWSDPPYGQMFQSNHRTATPKFAHIKGDDRPLVEYLPLVTDIPVWYVCCRWDTAPVFMDAIADAGHAIVNWIVWHKSRGGMGDLEAAYRPTHETILYCSKGRVPFARDGRDDDTWDIAADAPASYEHPTQKPIALPLRAIENHAPTGSIVYDPFLGSGPSLIAAHRTGRRCYGMEIEPRYADVILRRAEAEGLSVERFNP
jgi:DNA modification methylase